MRTLLSMRIPSRCLAESKIKRHGALWWNTWFYGTMKQVTGARVYTHGLTKAEIKELKRLFDWLQEERKITEYTWDKDGDMVKDLVDHYERISNKFLKSPLCGRKEEGKEDENGFG